VYVCVCVFARARAYKRQIHSSPSTYSESSYCRLGGGESREFTRSQLSTETYYLLAALTRPEPILLNFPPAHIVDNVNVHYIIM
jgi:hypothetical protein